MIEPFENRAARKKSTVGSQKNAVLLWQRTSSLFCSCGRKIAGVEVPNRFTSPYSPDLAPSELFPNMKKWLAYYAEGINKLEPLWTSFQATLVLNNLIITLTTITIKSWWPIFLVENYHWVTWNMIYSVKKICFRKT